MSYSRKAREAQIDAILDGNGDQGFTGPITLHCRNGAVESIEAPMKFRPDDESVTMNRSETTRLRPVRWQPGERKEA